MSNVIEMTEATPQKRREILEQSFGANLPGGPIVLDEYGQVNPAKLFFGDSLEIDEGEATAE